MDDDQLTDAFLQQSSSRMAERHGVEGPVGQPDFKSGCLSRLDFVENAKSTCFRAA